jgi:hypothetical protein
MIPVMMPAKGGAPLATAMPRHNGSATKKTTIPASRSALVLFFLLNVFIYCMIVIGINGDPLDEKSNCIC